jgi:hypothetical protein
MLADVPDLVQPPICGAQTSMTRSTNQLPGEDLSHVVPVPLLPSLRNAARSV